MKLTEFGATASSSLNESFTISGTTATFTGVAHNENTSSGSTGSTRVGFGLQASITVDGVYYTSYDSSLYSAYITQSYEEPNSCLLADTEVMLADGSTKLAKDLTVKDRVLTFNHLTGAYEANNISFVVSNVGMHDVITLTFDNGKTMKLADGHGLFNSDSMKYEIYYGDEFFDHIGEHFISVEKVDGEYINKPVRLIGVSISKDYVETYTPISSYQYNVIADNMLTMPDDIDGMFDMYEYYDNLQIKQDALNEIISQYGLWTYDNFKDYAPEYAFEIMNFKYIKAALLSGSMTVEKVNHLLACYLPMIVEQNNLEWDCEHQKFLPDNYVELLKSKSNN